MNLIPIFTLIQRKALWLSVVFFALLFTPSCKKKGALAPGFNDTDLPGFFTDTITLNSSQRLIDSLATSRTTLNLLGAINDPVFGFTTAGFASQVHLSSASVNFGNPAELVCDSVILTLKTNSGYGDILTPVSVSVFELTQNLYFDSTYYHLSSLTYNAISIGNTSYKLNFTDSVLIDGVKAAPHIKVKLKTGFGTKILQQGSFSDNASFLSFLKGIYVVPTNSHSAPYSGNGSAKMFPPYEWGIPVGKGAIGYLDLISTVSKLTLYYTNTSTGVSTKYIFNINNSCARFNTFQHNYNNTPVEAALNGNATAANLLYLQSMAGVSIKINLPYLSNMSSLSPISINKAELILPVEQGTFSTFGLPEKFVLVAVDSAGKDAFVKDFFEPSTHYDGQYDAKLGAYKFTITRHIHQLINEGKKDFGLYLYVSGRAVNASRVMLHNEKHQTSPMKLNLVYTKIL